MKHFACFKLPAVFRKPISSDSPDANPNRLQADLMSVIEQLTSCWPTDSVGPYDKFSDQ